MAAPGDVTKPPLLLSCNGKRMLTPLEKSAIAVCLVKNKHLRGGGGTPVHTSLHTFRDNSRITVATDHNDAGNMR